MAITHSFNDEENIALGGTWFDDYGRPICSWLWDTETRILDVRCGTFGRKKDLSLFNEDATPKSELRSRLPELALRIAEDLGKAKNAS